VPSIPNFFSTFTMMLNFVKAFFYINWYHDVAFVLDSVYVLYYNYWFANVYHPCTSGIIATWSLLVYDLFNLLLNFVSKYFIEDFWVYVHQGYWPITFFFFNVSLPVFGIRVKLAL
jgi:hypothetical protein